MKKQLPDIMNQGIVPFFIAALVITALPYSANAESRVGHPCSGETKEAPCYFLQGADGQRNQPEAFTHEKETTISYHGQTPVDRLIKIYRQCVLIHNYSSPRVVYFVPAGTLIEWTKFKQNRLVNSDGGDAVTIEGGCFGEDLPDLCGRYPPTNGKENRAHRGEITLTSGYSRRATYRCVNPAPDFDTCTTTPSRGWHLVGSIMGVCVYEPPGSGDGGSDGGSDGGPDSGGADGGGDGGG